MLQRATWVLAVSLLSARCAEGDLYLSSLVDVDSKAVCTDGSPAGYYWEPSATNGPTWIVYLQGGDWCYSEESCKERCHDPAEVLCGSSHWPTQLIDRERGCGGTTLSGERGRACGIFTPVPAEDIAGGVLHTANKVLVAYCTSDAHMGDAEEFGFHFRGARVIQAVLRDLVVRRGLGRRDQKELLLFAGGSAGARGAMVHLDFVGDMLEAAGAKDVEVVGLLDSPLWVDLPHQGISMSLMEQTKSIHRYARVKHVDDDCVKKYGEEEAWKCLFGEYRMPFVKTPYLLVASPYDRFQLQFYLDHPPVTQEEQVFAEMMASKVLGVVKAINSEKHAVFSWACFSHALSLSDRFHLDATNDGTTMLQALEQFLAALPRGVTQHWVDHCEGFACGKHCRHEHGGARLRIGGAWSGEPGGSGGGVGRQAPGKPVPAPGAAASTTVPAELAILQRLKTTPAAKGETSSTSALPRPVSSMEAAPSSTTAEIILLPSGDGEEIPLAEFRQRMHGSFDVEVLAQVAPVEFAALTEAEKVYVVQRMVQAFAGVAGVDADAIRSESATPSSVSLFSGWRKCLAAQASVQASTKGHINNIVAAFTASTAKDAVAEELSKASGVSRIAGGALASSAVRISAHARGMVDFGVADADSTGGVTFHEFVQVTNTATPPLSIPQATYAFRMLDIDQNSELKEEEFGLGVQEPNAGPISMVDFKSRMLDRYDSIKEALDALGASPFSHEADFVRGTGTFQPPLSLEQAHYAFDGLDANHDRALSGREIVAVLEAGHFFPKPEDLHKAGALATGPSFVDEPHRSQTVWAILGVLFSVLLLPGVFLVVLLPTDSRVGSIRAVMKIGAMQGLGHVGGFHAALPPIALRHFAGGKPWGAGRPLEEAVAEVPLAICGRGVDGNERHFLRPSRVSWYLLSLCAFALRRHAAAVERLRSRLALRAASTKRRRALEAAGVSLFLPSAARAEEAAQSAAPERANLLAQFPRFGVGDVNFPKWASGEWNARSELFSVEFPQGEALAPQAGLRAKRLVGQAGSLDAYRLSFEEVGGKLVMDRSGGLRCCLLPLGNEGQAEPIEWGGKQDQDVAFLKLKQSGFTVRTEMRALLKAGVVPDGRSDLFNVSEVFFAATEAPPSITPVRVVDKFKQVGEEIQEIIRVDVFPEQLQSADLPPVAGDLGTPIAEFKYRVLLSKRQA